MRKFLGAIGVLVALICSTAFSGFGAAYDTHPGDYTWRTQTVIDWLQAPILGLVTLLFLSVVVEMYRSRVKASRGLWWMVLGLSLTTMAVWWAFVFPLEARIMSWDANRPPADWDAVASLHTSWSAIGILPGLLTGAVLLLVLKKDRRA